jgi:PilZ domain
MVDVRNVKGRVMCDERRSDNRKRLLLEARWGSMSSTHEARVDDLSLGGCFVNSVARVEPNEAINLEIQLPSGKWLPLRGHVASYHPGVGFGLSFASLSESEVTVLRQLMSSMEEKLS